MATLEIFSANFWRTVGSRFIEGDAEMVFKENHFLTQSQICLLYTSSGSSRTPAAGR